jgi:uncharacterized protein YneF (UPF0154 family)
MSPNTTLQLWVIFEIVLLIFLVAGFFYVIRLLVKALKKYLREDTQNKPEN